ncbi:hypothetical protein CHLNCDRAFT_51553 [Chlorella variabilis]|uniref:SET domain-containing protein n=1 Tax=Chlorella variabilis TaxID=554065 RepID=E1ZCA9_CHLVA|nr:hypothetical protein CHLNCDRAFT_51553 [Chlorella variabilis]EFN56780.1 hypothetical protein CHLNCDRAFT_51553 [Chlorella variabilis]|eukprot:XP_005848882.1 hypothetical protein CHLNCDRAFT_51553 [Chlorella variabilis]
MAPASTTSASCPCGGGGGAAAPARSSDGDCAAAAKEESRVNALGQQLRDWIEDAGGYVHPALQLSMATPYGRGVVAVEAVVPEQRQPLIAVPERLLLTTEVAAQQLGPLLLRQLQPPAPPGAWWPLGLRRQQQQHRQQISQADPTLLLALLLASERAKASASPWWPYIAALPEDIPCGWALSQKQLAAELAALGSMASDWAPQVRAAAAAVDRQAASAVATWGKELSVSAADVRFTTSAGEACAAVHSRSKGALQALPRGTEFCVSYVAGTSPLNMLLNFGFVPHEHRR